MGTSFSLAHSWHLSAVPTATANAFATAKGGKIQGGLYLSGWADIWASTLFFFPLVTAALYVGIRIFTSVSQLYWISQLVGPSKDG
jgi:hypothetical protein